MEKKQSSIDWLENQLKKRYSLMNSEPLFEQAKAMHKEEIQYAYWEGGMDKPKGSKECEQYYNETFGGGE